MKKKVKLPKLPQVIYKRHETRQILNVSVGIHNYFVLVYITQAYRGTLEQPPEPSEIEIYKVFDASFKEITNQIDDKNMELLNEYLYTIDHDNS